MQNIQEQSLTNQFFKPVVEALSHSQHTRHCKKISDYDWTVMGVTRVLGNYESGRDFLTAWNLREVNDIHFAHFFQTAASARRGTMVREINTQVAASMPAHRHNAVDAFAELACFDIYAGDGHYIGASAHDKQIQGKKRPCGHFYALDLRTHGMTHLSASDLQGGIKKSEHDMSALKRLGGKVLRQGAKQGRKVLYVWDPAGISIEMWGKWKQQYGVYFLSRVKDNMRFVEVRNADWDPEDPVNAGVVSDKVVTTVGSPVRLRWIVYVCPESGETYEFVTTEMTIRPGVLAWLYKRRWDIEKTYDTMKNQFGQTKAWGNSDEAKTMQAQFICLTHNLAVLIESQIGVEDEKEVKRATQRAEKREALATRHGRMFAPQYRNPRKRTQLGAKLIRWLRYCLINQTLLSDAIRKLTRIYATF